MNTSKDDEKSDNTDMNSTELQKKPSSNNTRSEEISEKAGHEQVLDMIVNKDDVTWRTILMELVNSNRMDPWNIDIKLLTKEYLRQIRALKNNEKHDFRVSAKMILAAALLLKLKSSRLLEGDLNALDQLFASTQPEEELEHDTMDLVDEILPDSEQQIEPHKLIPRTPQPRKRKVSIYDLVDALEKALEVKERRIMRRMPTLEVEVPKKKPDVTILMNHLFEQIERLYNQERDKVLFSDLTPGDEREDKIVTFIPLLHLDNARKINMKQHQMFGPIEVHLANKEEEATLVNALKEEDSEK